MWHSASSAGPELLFLDEPTTGFDPEARREFWELIRALAGGGTTILLTSALPAGSRRARPTGWASSTVATSSPAPGPANSVAGHSRRRPCPGRARPASESAQTQTPTAFVAELASRFPDGEVPGLTVSRPSLEDVYLSMIDNAVGLEQLESLATLGEQQ